MLAKGFTTEPICAEYWGPAEQEDKHAEGALYPKLPTKRAEILMLRWQSKGEVSYAATMQIWDSSADVGITLYTLKYRTAHADHEVLSHS